MKEKIYTIPVNDAFKEDCECPICLLEKDLEKDSIDFILGPSLMEPDNRLETNKKGFCRRHFEKLYNRQENRLGLSLIFETHIEHQMAELKELYKKSSKAIENETNMNAVKNIAGKVSKKQTAATKFVDKAYDFLSHLEDNCEVCDRMDRIMDRYLDTIVWMYFKDNEFEKRFNEGKGFCLHHYKMLLQAAKEHLSPKQCAIFTSNLVELMDKNMDRILEDVKWFSQKFDYRNQNASWKNSKDAVPRTIEKFASYCDLKK